MLYWGGQILAFLPGAWLTPEHPAHMPRLLGGWMTLMMCGVVAFQALWIWQRLTLAAGAIATHNPLVSRLLSHTRTVGSATLVALLLLALITIALGNAVVGPNSWLDGLFAVFSLGLLFSCGLAARCLCKAEIAVTPEAKPSVFWTAVQFAYAGLTAGAISRRSTRIAAAAGILEPSTGPA